MAKVKHTENHYTYWIMQWQRRRDKPAKSLNKALELFREIKGSLIVEIGSQRTECSDIDEEKDCCIDGHSSELFAKEGVNFHTCDIDTEASQLVRNILESKGLLEGSSIWNGDGIKFLNRGQFPSKIDLLYLDAWDVAPGTPYAENHLTAYNAAAPYLNDQHIILIDDTDIAWSDTHGLEIDNQAKAGKGELLVPFLLDKDYKLRWEGRQVCLTNY
tara:strand:- start:1028 stop:1675 length:648 start_codon:yes stop_codon:yes gene_type:complete